MRNRTIITNVKPVLEDGQYYIKRVAGEDVTVTADIFSDGEEAIRASLLYKHEKVKKWSEILMKPQEGDSWKAVFPVQELGFYAYKIEAWLDPLHTWHEDILNKYAHGQYLSSELKTGATLLLEAAKNANKAMARQLETWAKEIADNARYQEALGVVTSPAFAEGISQCFIKQFPSEFDKSLRVRVGRQKEMFSTWYQMFPRSASHTPGKHGTLKDCETLLPRVAEMGFDVLFFPPIFPIGKTNRKGKNNETIAEKQDPGSPWAVGSEEGGHKTIHPQLGTMEDFEHLIAAAKEQGIEIALDMGLRCSPDHPYVKEHPSWFHWTSDGQLKTDEKPPLIYRDIVDFNFESDDWQGLWNELKSIHLFWAEKGVRIFYGSVPHYQPFGFRQWLIQEVQVKFPDVIFVSGALTPRYRMMEMIAKTGFNQSFTYFIWKTTKQELESYMTELTKSESREFLLPNFFCNTPDILPAYLADAGEREFMLRYALAATLGSNCGIYGPAFELMYNQKYPQSKERYYHSEKFEIANHKWHIRNRVTKLITNLNHLRKEQPALQNIFNLHFTKSDNEHFLSFVKATPDRSNIIWCVVNLDTHHSHSGYVEIPKEFLGIKGGWVNLRMEDLLTGEIYHWFNDWNYVELKLEKLPLHVFRVTF